MTSTPTAVRVSETGSPTCPAPDVGASKPSKRSSVSVSPAARGGAGSHVSARRDSGVGREAGRRGMRPIRSRRAPQAGWLTPLLILGLFMTGLLGGFGLSRHTRSVAPTLVLPLRESSSHTTLLPPPRIPAPLTAAPPPSPSSPPLAASVFTPAVASTTQRVGRARGGTHPVRYVRHGRHGGVPAQLGGQRASCGRWYV